LAKQSLLFYSRNVAGFHLTWEPAALIVAINGSDVQSVDDLHRFLSDWPIGRPVKIDIVRGQRRRVLVIVPKEAVE